MKSGSNSETTTTQGHNEGPKEKSKVLRRAKKLKDTKESTLKNVYIKRDMTYQEMQKRRLLVDEESRREKET